MVTSRMQLYLLSELLTAARFCLMVELFEEDGVRGARRYLDHLKMEYAF